LRLKQAKLCSHVKQEIEDNFHFRTAFMVQCIFSRWRHRTAQHRHHMALNELRETLAEQFGCGGVRARVHGVVAAIEDQRVQLAMWEAFTRWALLVRMQRAPTWRQSIPMSSTIEFMSPWQSHRVLPWNSLPANVTYKSQVTTFTTHPSAVDSISLYILSPAGLKVGDMIVIDAGTAREEFNTIASLTTPLSLQSPLQKKHDSGAAVTTLRQESCVTTPQSVLRNAVPVGTSTATYTPRTIGYRVINTTSPDVPVPMATVGVDRNHDGRPDYFYTGVDRDHNGIPDTLESGAGPEVMSKPGSRSHPLWRCQGLEPFATSQVRILSPTPSAPASPRTAQRSMQPCGSATSVGTLWETEASSAPKTITRIISPRGSSTYGSVQAPPTVMRAVSPRSAAFSEVVPPRVISPASTTMGAIVSGGGSIRTGSISPRRADRAGPPRSLSGSLRSVHAAPVM